MGLRRLFQHGVPDAGKASCWRDARGEVMIESLLVYGVTVILLFLMLTVFSLLYQNWNVQTIANDTATRLAQEYKYKNADLTAEDNLSLEALLAIRPYRYMFNKNELETSAQNRGKQYAKNRLRATTFAVDVGEPIITVEEERDGLARRHLAVTVSGTYQVPGSEILKYLGGTGDVEFKHTAYAECMDLSDYIITTNFASDAAGVLSSYTAGGKLVSSMLDAIDSVIKLFKEATQEE